MMLRPLKQILSTAVVALAFFSLVTGGYAHWVHAPSTAALLLLITWSVCTLLFQASLFVRPWFPARLLLLPTVPVIVLLIQNSMHYYQILQAGIIQATPPPITLYAAVILGAWFFASLFPQKLKDKSLKVERKYVAFLLTFLLLTFNFVTASIIGWFFLFALSDNPPPPYTVGLPPRLAVVFGNMVLPDGTCGQIMRDRTRAAIDLYKKGQVQKILLSGACSGQDGTGRDEPLAMKRLCLDRGIPESDLFLDPVGINTRASAESTRQLLNHLPQMDIVAVSTPSHLPRIRVAFAHAGIPCYSVTAPTPDWTPEDPVVIAREMIGLPIYMFVPSYRPAKGVAMGITPSSHPRLVVTKSKNLLEIYDGDRLARTYKCITGTHAGDKEVEGDRKTPLGVFHIVYKNPESKFHLSMGLDYPNAEDCARGINAGLLTQAQVDDILAAAKSDLALEANQKRLWKSPLGGEIFIHGHAEGRDNTAGCIAVTNLEIEELYAICDVGTEVEIRP